MDISTGAKMPDYIPKTRNTVQEILEDHFPDFQSSYDADYSGIYGKFNGSTGSPQAWRGSLNPSADSWNAAIIQLLVLQLIF